MFMPKSMPYDPQWVLDLARSQRPTDVALHEALKRATRTVGLCACGCGSPYFVDPNSPEWRHGYVVVLEAEEKTESITEIAKNGTVLGTRTGGKDVVIEVQKDGTIGDIEIGVSHEENSGRNK